METLDGLGVPYKVVTRRRVRDLTAPEDCRFNDWAKIYVDERELAKWLAQKIEEEINRQ